MLSEVLPSGILLAHLLDLFYWQISLWQHSMFYWLESVGSSISFFLIAEWLANAGPNASNSTNLSMDPYCPILIVHLFFVHGTGSSWPSRLFDRSKSNNLSCLRGIVLMYDCLSSTVPFVIRLAFHRTGNYIISPYRNELNNVQMILFRDLCWFSTITSESR